MIPNQKVEYWADLLDNLDPFMDEVFTFLDEAQIDVFNLQIDHSALRFKENESVDKLKEEIEKTSTRLSGAIVNGRVIYIYKLHNPLVYKEYKIPCIELPYPADRHPFTKDGWEHVEFVIPETTPDNLESIFLSKYVDDPNASKIILRYDNSDAQDVHIWVADATKTLSELVAGKYDEIFVRPTSGTFKKK